MLRTRRLDHQPLVDVWLDATYVHVREHRHVTSKAVVIATGLRADGHREVLGVDVGTRRTTCSGASWLVGALLVEINDELIAAERRDIAAASVADLTDGTAERALPAAPRT